MMKYKRLTTKDEEGNWQVWEDDYSHPFEALQVAIDRLAELEDKMENGTLIELPDTAHKFAVVEYSWQKKKPLKVVEYYPCSYDFQSKRIVNCYLSDNMNFYIVEKDFSTREEAEKRLKELQNG